MQQTNKISNFARNVSYDVQYVKTIGSVSIFSARQNQQQFRLYVVEGSIIHHDLAIDIAKSLLLSASHSVHFKQVEKIFPVIIDEKDYLVFVFMESFSKSSQTQKFYDWQINELLGDDLEMFNQYKDFLFIDEVNQNDVITYPTFNFIKYTSQAEVNKQPNHTQSNIIQQFFDYFEKIKKHQKYNEDQYVEEIIKTQIETLSQCKFDAYNCKLYQMKNVEQHADENTEKLVVLPHTSRSLLYSNIRNENIEQSHNIKIIRSSKSISKEQFYYSGECLGQKSPLIFNLDINEIIKLYPESQMYSMFQNIFKQYHKILQFLYDGKNQYKLINPKQTQVEITRNGQLTQFNLAIVDVKQEEKEIQVSLETNLFMFMQYCFYRGNEQLYEILVKNIQLNPNTIQQLIKIFDQDMMKQQGIQINSKFENIRNIFQNTEIVENQQDILLFSQVFANQENQTTISISCEALLLLENITNIFIIMYIKDNSIQFIIMYPQITLSDSKNQNLLKDSLENAISNKNAQKAEILLVQSVHFFKKCLDQTHRMQILSHSLFHIDDLIIYNDKIQFQYSKDKTCEQGNFQMRSIQQWFKAQYKDIIFEKGSIIEDLFQIMRNKYYTIGKQIKHICNSDYDSDTINFEFDKGVQEENFNHYICWKNEKYTDTQSEDVQDEYYLIFSLNGLSQEQKLQKIKNFGLLYQIKLKYSGNNQYYHIKEVNMHNCFNQMYIFENENNLQLVMFTLNNSQKNYDNLIDICTMINDQEIELKIPNSVQVSLKVIDNQYMVEKKFISTCDNRKYSFENELALQQKYNTIFDDYIQKAKKYLNFKNEKFYQPQKSIIDEENKTIITTCYLQLNYVFQCFTNLEQAIKFILKLILQVQLLNEKKFIHRDLKVDNIMAYTNYMCNSEIVFEPIIIDFNVSTQTSEQIQTMIGTEHTQIPFLSNAELYFQDTYSMGILIYMFLTNSYPYNRISFQLNKQINTVQLVFIPSKIMLYINQYLQIYNVTEQNKFKIQLEHLTSIQNILQKVDKTPVYCYKQIYQVSDEVQDTLYQKMGLLGKYINYIFQFSQFLHFYSCRCYDHTLVAYDYSQNNYFKAYTIQQFLSQKRVSYEVFQLLADLFNFVYVMNQCKLMVDQLACDDFIIIYEQNKYKQLVFQSIEKIQIHDDSGNRCQITLNSILQAVYNKFKIQDKTIKQLVDILQIQINQNYYDITKLDCVQCNLYIEGLYEEKIRDNIEQNNKQVLQTLSVEMVLLKNFIKLMILRR